MLFKSLWNRAIADLLIRYRSVGEIHLYHSLDFHGALAPLYLEASGLPPIPVALTLHNALYQGSLAETLQASEWRDIEMALMLPNSRHYIEFEGCAAAALLARARALITIRSGRPPALRIAHPTTTRGCATTSARSQRLQHAPRGHPVHTASSKGGRDRRREPRVWTAGGDTPTLPQP